MDLSGYVNVTEITRLRAQVFAARSMEDEINQSLDDVVALLEAEIGRLKVSLEAYRLSNHVRRQELIRWHVAALDERQDTLESLKALLQDNEGPAFH